MGRNRLTTPRFHIKAHHAYFNSAAIIECKIKKGIWCDFKFRKNRLYFIFNKKYEGIPCGEPTSVRQSALSVKRRFKKMKIPLVQGTFNMKYSKKKKIWYVNLGMDISKGAQNGKKQRRRTKVS